ncbi:MAG: isopentenyl-diphosphate Delta-isomerase [Deltaproteobacteria bacterium]|nr:isopentenyl-diphosphate Delta-isomerase [Deltaproteobacteria bacterium]
MAGRTDDIASPKELLILVDKNDNIMGYENKEMCHQGEGLLHRAFSIFLFNDQQQMLIQKRSAEKFLWPLHWWSNSVCSHPRKGESYEEATVRRLKEELGVETPLHFLFKFQYQARFKNIGSENELCSVYIGKADGIIRANPSEIAEWKYVDCEELNKGIQVHPHLYTPWFTMEWERIQRGHRFEIENL